jgi:hypothetical protein
MAETAVSKDAVRTQQALDPFCSSLDAKSTSVKVEYFTDQYGVIYSRPDGEPQLLVPNGLVSEIISLNQNPIYAPNGQAIL